VITRLFQQEEDGDGEETEEQAGNAKSLDVTEVGEVMTDY
jgi:hypothetical protein